MTIARLVQVLQQLGDEHGHECEVFIVDDEGEWPFCIHPDREALGERRVVVYLDVTGEPDAVLPLDEGVSN